LWGRLEIENARVYLIPPQTVARTLSNVETGPKRVI
jgi:hypothetical protein